MYHVSKNVYTIYHKQDVIYKFAKGNNIIENDVLKMQPMTKYDTLPELHTILYLILFYSQTKRKIN